MQRLRGIVVGMVLLYLLIVALLFLTGMIGLFWLLLLMLVSIFIVPFFVALSIPTSIQIPLALISFVLSLILLHASAPAFSQALGIEVLPLIEEGGVVWWRIAFFLFLSLSVYTVINRMLLALIRS